MGYFLFEDACFLVNRQERSYASWESRTYRRFTDWVNFQAIRSRSVTSFVWRCLLGVKEKDTVWSGVIIF